MIALLLFLSAIGDPVINGVDVGEYDVPRLMAFADEAWHRGDYVTIVKTMDRVIELEPDNIEAYSVCAWLIWSSRDDPDDPNHMGDESVARRYLEEAVRRNPESGEAAWELGYHLMDRVGDAVAAAAWLERATRLPGAPQQAQRTFGHALYYSERYAEAAAWFQKAFDGGHIEVGVRDINRIKGLKRALEPDALLRSGGSLDGPPGAAVPRVLRDARFDQNEDGFFEARTLLLDDPADLDGEPDYQLVYDGRKVIYRVDWRWRSVAWDRDDDGQFAETETILVDRDLDGTADNLPTLDALKAGRAAAPRPELAMVFGPDTGRLGIDGSGAAVEVKPEAVDGQVVIRPVATILCERAPLSLVLLARQPGREGHRPVVTVELKPGAYTLNQGDGPTAELVLPAEALPAGRWFLAVQLRFGEVPMAEWLDEAHIAVNADGRVTLQTPTEADLNPPLPEPPGGPDGRPMPELPPGGFAHPPGAPGGPPPTTPL